MDEAWRIHLVWQAVQRGEITPSRAAELLVDVPDDEGDAGQPVAASEIGGCPVRPTEYPAHQLRESCLLPVGEGVEAIGPPHGDVDNVRFLKLDCGFRTSAVLARASAMRELISGVMLLQGIVARGAAPFSRVGLTVGSVSCGRGDACGFQNPAVALTCAFRRRARTR